MFDGIHLRQFCVPVPKTSQCVSKQCIILILMYLSPYKLTCFPPKKTTRSAQTILHICFRHFSAIPSKPKSPRVYDRYHFDTNQKLFHVSIITSIYTTETYYYPSHSLYSLPSNTRDIKKSFAFASFSPLFYLSVKRFYALFSALLIPHHRQHHLMFLLNCTHTKRELCAVAPPLLAHTSQKIDISSIIPIFATFCTYFFSQPLHIVMNDVTCS